MRTKGLDVDLFRRRARVKKGIFVPIKHYGESQESLDMEPRPVGWVRSLTNWLPVRYAIIRLGILARFSIALKLHGLLFGESNRRS